MATQQVNGAPSPARRHDPYQQAIPDSYRTIQGPASSSRNQSRRGSNSTYHSVGPSNSAASTSAATVPPSQFSYYETGNAGDGSYSSYKYNHQNPSQTTMFPAHQQQQQQHQGHHYGGRQQQHNNGNSSYHYGHQNYYNQQQQQQGPCGDCEGYGKQFACVPQQNSGNGDNCGPNAFACFPNAMMDQLVQGPNMNGPPGHNHGGRHNQHLHHQQNGVGAPYKDLPEMDTDCPTVAGCLAPPPPPSYESNLAIPIPNKGGEKGTSEDDEEAPNYVEGVVVKTSESIVRTELNGRVPYLHFPPLAEMSRIVKEAQAIQEAEDAEALKANPDTPLGPDGKIKKSYFPVFFGQVLFSTSRDHLVWMLLHLTGLLPTVVSNHSPGCFTCYFTSMEECGAILSLNKRVLFDKEGLWVAENNYQMELIFNSANYWRLQQQNGDKNKRGGEGGEGQNQEDRNKDASGNPRLPRGALVVELPVHGGAGSGNQHRGQRGQGRMR